MKKLLALGLLLATPCLAKIRQPEIDRLGVDFEKSFGKQNINWGVRNADDRKWYNRIKDRYEKLKPINVAASTETKIPKIIHQIWLGSKFPDKFRRWQETWIEKHPEWEYKLWMDEDIAELELENIALFKESKNWGQKADIARYEILYRFGGMYVDIDFECIMPFDALFHRYSFFTGISSGVDLFESNNALIAASPGHPIMRACIDNMTLKSKYTQLISMVVNTTGPGFFTEQIMELEDQMGDDMIVFPCSYLYPLGLHDGEPPRHTYLKYESFGIHHWSASWVVQRHYTKGRCGCGECKAKRLAEKKEKQAQERQARTKPYKK